MRRSAGVSDSIAASAAPSGAGRTSGGCGAVSWAKTGLPPAARIVTGTGPAGSSKVMRVVSPARSSAPSVASTSALPTVGWPANGTSCAGVKILSLRVWAGSSGGRTKTVSDRLNSRAIACICSPARPAASGSTASGLPPKIRSVNTSAVTKR